MRFSLINFEDLPSIWCLSNIWTSSPFLKRAIHGEEGGKGTISTLAASVASLSTPAKTVNNCRGILSLINDWITPGLAFAAAHRQTELTINPAVWLLEIF